MRKLLAQGRMTKVTERTYSSLAATPGLTSPPHALAVQTAPPDVSPLCNSVEEWLRKRISTHGLIRCSKRDQLSTSELSIRLSTAPHKSVTFPIALTLRLHATQETAPENPQAAEARHAKTWPAATTASATAESITAIVALTQRE